MQLFDRLAKGDDDDHRDRRISGLHPVQGARRQGRVRRARPTGWSATPLIVGAVNKAPHPEAAKLFVDWAMSKRGQAWYQTNPNLYYGSVRTDAPPMPTGVRLRDSSCSIPTDWDDYAARRAMCSPRNGTRMLGL